MDLIIQIIGFCFIPLLGILILSGMRDIYLGLKEHFGFQTLRITELPFHLKTFQFDKNFGYRKFNSDFCKN